MREFDKNQKVAIIALGFVAIFIFFGAAWQFKTRLNKPFDTGQTKKNQKVTFGCQTGDCANDISSLMTENPATATGTPVASENLEVPGYLLATSSNTVDPSLNFEQDPSVMTGDSKQAELEKLLTGGVSATSLRSLMLQSGADQKMLEQISDEDLLKVYQESLQNQPNSEASGNLPSASEPITSSTVK